MLSTIAFSLCFFRDDFGQPSQSFIKVLFNLMKQNYSYCIKICYQMGTKQCRQCEQIKSESPAFGEYELYYDEGKQYALIQKISENNVGLHKKIQQELQKRKSIECKHLVKLLSYEIVELPHEVKVTMHYQYIPKTLRQYLEQMKFKKAIIGQKQLFGIIYGVQSALKSLYENGIAHGCINLDTILCKNNFFKITDVSSTTYITSYDLTMKGSRQQFLSQRLLNNLSYKIYNSNSELDDDLFSLGIIILMIISKSKPQDFFDWQQTTKNLVGSLNKKYIQQCIRLMKRNFSSKFSYTVNEMLKMNPPKSKQEESSTYLTEQLHNLEQNFSRIISKIKNRSQESSVKQSRYFSSQKHRRINDL